MALGVVGVNDARLQIRPAQEQGFGVGVGLHIRVVVEVVAAEIAEERVVKIQVADATLVQCVRRYFQAQPFDAGVAVSRHQPQQVDRVGGGELAGAEAVRCAVADGADERAGLAVELPGLRQEMADRTFAVGASNANQTQLLLRPLVKALGDGDAPSLQRRHADYALGVLGVVRAPD